MLIQLKLLWTKVKLFFKKYWIILVSTIVGILSLILGIFIATKRNSNTPKVIIAENKKEEVQRQIAEVEAKAAIEIGRAQGREEAVIQEVQAIAQEPDSRKRRERLAALLARN